MPESFASAALSRPKHTTRTLEIEGYWTPAEAAQKLGLSTRTLHRLDVMRKGPPRTRIAGRIYYRTEAVIQWLKDQESAEVRVNGRRGAK
jgi:hypothetical protein